MVPISGEPVEIYDLMGKDLALYCIFCLTKQIVLTYVVEN